MHSKPSASPLPTQNEAEGTEAGERSQSHPLTCGYTPQPNHLHGSKADNLPQDTAVEATFICKILHVPQLFQEDFQTEVIISLLSLATHIVSGLWHSLAPPLPSALPATSTTKTPKNFRNIFILKCSPPFKKKFPSREEISFHFNPTTRRMSAQLFFDRQIIESKRKCH